MLLVQVQCRARLCTKSRRELVNQGINYRIVRGFSRGAAEERVVKRSWISQEC